MNYFDYNATTPIDKEVVEAMLPFLYNNFGNPSSNSDYGRITKTAIEKARQQVASILNCQSSEITFTSGGSESNNMVIKGVAYTYKHKGNHIITSTIEHPAVLNPLKFLEENGYEITYLPVDEFGMVNPKSVEEAIRDNTILITIMHSNNEVGTLQPIKEIGRIANAKKVLFHTDASQSVGKVLVDVRDLKVDFLTIVGHKLYAPKGIGALYIREGINIEPLIHGASQEQGKRAGTENVIFDVALGKACAIAQEKLKSDSTLNLTNYLLMELTKNFGERIKLNGHPTLRLPNTLNISFIGVNGHEIVEKLGEIVVSAGSACHSGQTSISPVLQAMNIPKEISRGAVRISIGRDTKIEEINYLVQKLVVLFN